MMHEKTPPVQFDSDSERCYFAVYLRFWIVSLVRNTRFGVCVFVSRALMAYEEVVCVCV